MALTKQHKEFIESVITYLFDFPKDPASLKIEVSKILEAFHSSVAIEHDYYQLKIFLLSPTTSLKRLEECSQEKTTVGDVQNYILELLTMHLESAAKEAKLTLEILAWDVLGLKKELIPEEHYKQEFKTKNENYHTQDTQTQNNTLSNETNTSNLPSLYFYEEGKLFKGRIYLDSSLRRIYAKINFLLPWWQKERLYTFTYNNLALEFEDEILESFLPKVKRHAQKSLATQIYTELQTRRLTELYVIGRAKLNPHLAQVLCNSVYLDLLLTKKIQLAHLVDISEVGANNLEDTVCKNLLKHDIISLQIAKNLTRYEKKVLAAYASQINKQIKIQDILGVTMRQTQILTIPLIINLITQQNNKLSLSIAKSFPLQMKELFVSPLYQDFFNNACDISWQNFATFKLEHCQFLLIPHIAELIKHNVFTLSAVTTFSSTLKNKLKKQRKKINLMLIEKQLTIAELDKFFNFELDLINEYPIVWTAIKSGIINPGEFPTFNKFDLDKNLASCAFAIILNRRLFAIMCEEPFMIDGHQDSITSIGNDLFTITNQTDISTKSLIDDVLYCHKSRLQNRLRIFFKSIGTDEQITDEINLLSAFQENILNSKFEVATEFFKALVELLEKNKNLLSQTKLGLFKKLDTEFADTQPIKTFMEYREENISNKM